MRYYIYDPETNDLIATICGDTNEECEQQAANRYDMDTYCGTYSPAFGFNGGLTNAV